MALLGGTLHPCDSRDRGAGIARTLGAQPDKASRGHRMLGLHQNHERETHVRLVKAQTSTKPLSDDHSLLVASRPLAERTLLTSSFVRSIVRADIKEMPVSRVFE